ncbi:YciI family protein [Lysobacter sp. A286]
MAKTFALVYSYSPDVALQDATRPAHLEHLRGLVDAGTLIAAGPWGPGDARGGLLIFRVDDRAAIQAIVDRDPFVTQGVVATSDIREWVPLLGPAAPALAAEKAAN